MIAAAAATAPTTSAAMRHPLAAIHRAAFRNGGAVVSPTEIQPGSMNAPSVRSSQCFAFQDFQPMPAPVCGVGIVNRPTHQRHASQRRAVQGLPAGGGFVRRELRVCHSSMVVFLSKKSIANASEKFAAVRKGCKWKQ